MGAGDYLINLLSAVIAVEYMDYGFQKKFCGWKRWGAFNVGCIIYFLTVTALDRLAAFEGALGFLYRAVLIGYAIWALQGKIQDFLLAGILWVLIAIIGTYAIFGVMGLFTGESLGEMLQMDGGLRLYASMVALIVKFSMGKIAAVLFRKKEGTSPRENRIVAGAFVFMTLLAMGLFWLEAGSLERSLRYGLTIGILADEVGIVIFLIQLYRCLGKYQKEKLEEQYRREREQERLEGFMDMYRVGREINHWRHDMLAELNVLYRMQKNGKYPEVERYMEKLCSELKDYPELPQPTGNEGLDAALMRIIPKCREKEIHFSYVILGKPDKVDPMLLGNLMDNLLCNGMEACQDVSGGKEMELVMRGQGDGLEISLENSIGESVLENNPKLTSRKQEKEKHGFGMESIWHIVEDCDGTYEYWEEENKFCQRIYLKHRKD